ncbi:pyridoxamine 5'-phosphate oxidase family protein [Arthrobacter sp. H5]|uniref:pyridoxamine 5'-phosphate oxidase family protein n=1 Tax=Arthrobacter sp. H5 TaxID=1267973 RepID=UPI000482D0D0|nr:pyridoxamine 5'-phosphate oxidase family protein [Arthrobacter sp. H5]
MTTPLDQDEFWDSPGLLRASQPLSTDECWALLAGQTTGRIGFLHEGLVTIFPLNYIVHDRGVYFRTSEEGVIARGQLERPRSSWTTWTRERAAGGPS